MSRRKRYAVVGAGSRAKMFLDAIAGPYRETSSLVGLCDVSLTRIAYHTQRLSARFDTPPVPAYHAQDFDRMIAETKPDIVIVTTIDALHHAYIVRAMDLGCEVICEKPMTTDAEKVRAIFDAIDRTGRSLRVTFNYRYAPHTTRVRELIQSGAIGAPLAVDLHWTLDTSHGADYFRRWHAEKHLSGGLLVHKATHHFDMVNWWINSFPKTVFAMGDLQFYGQKAAKRRGHSADYARSLDAPVDDPFRLNWDANPELAALYSGPAEVESGYVRDRNVFGPHVTIEDTLTVSARYRSGVLLSYSLLAYSPWEGFRAAVTGTRGRLELYSRHSAHAVAPADEKAAADAGREINRITYFPMFGVPEDIAIPAAHGAHGGGDSVLLEHLFNANPPADAFGRAATHIDGAASCLLGIAANQSIATGRSVEIDDLLKLPGQALSPCGGA